MTIHKGGSVKKALTFDAQNSNFDSWFQQRKLTKSSWSDLKAFKDMGVFSLKGFCHPYLQICQNFQVSKNIDAHNPECHEVFGWMYRGTFDSCNWEKQNMDKLVYCDQQKLCHFQKQGEFRVRGFLMTYYRNRSHKICPGLHAIANIANV